MARAGSAAFLPDNPPAVCERPAPVFSPEDFANVNFSLLRSIGENRGAPAAASGYSRGRLRREYRPRGAPAMGFGLFQVLQTL